MKRISIILLCVFVCVYSWAQTKSCMTIINELTKNVNEWDEETGIKYILANNDSFDKNNEIDTWLYNLALGTRYYTLGKYIEALPCLRHVTEVIDKYGHEMEIKGNSKFLVAYYWEALCEFHTHATKDLILSKLQRAKAAFEQYGQTGSDYYQQVLSDINAIQSGRIDLLPTIQAAISFAMSGSHQEAISLLEGITGSSSPLLTIKDAAPYILVLGNSYVAVGRLDDAEILYLNALAELDEGNENYRYICDALGVIYAQVHNYQKAKEYSSLSKKLHEKYLDFDYTYIRCLANCAIVENGIGNYFMAKLFIDVALKYMRRGIGYQASNVITESMASIAAITGRNVNAKEMSDNANKTTQLRPYLQMLSNAAMIYQEAGFWDDAVLCIKEGISMNEELGDTNALIYNNLAYLYLVQSKIEEALTNYKKAASLSQTEYEGTEIYFNYALALWLSHSSECVNVAADASKILNQSIANNFSFLSEKERYNYYKHFEFYLPMLNLMFYESGNEEQYGYIYDNILITKGLLLRTSNGVRNAILSSSDEQAKADYGRLVSLRQQIFNERDSIRRTEINAEIEVLDKKLSRCAAGYDAFVKSNNIKWQDVRASLKEGEIAIEFYNIPIMYPNDTIQKIDGDPRYCAVILKQNFENPHIIPLCKENELEDFDIDLLYNDSILYNLIWKPLEKELIGVKNIYFAADRELHKIAVEYALTPEGNRMNDIYNLFRLSSTRVLTERQNKMSTSNAVLFGGLRYDLESDQLIAESRSSGLKTTKAARSAGFDNFRYGVEYLPGTKEEVEEIYQDYLSTKKAHCKLITDTAGTEEAFKNLVGQDIGVIHLATHGFFWTEEEAEKRSYVSFLANPMRQDSYEDAALMRSGLFFSGANIGLAGEQLPDDVEDGILTAQELSSMNLGNVDMVVMSACQSGLGETFGEGVFGLQRGFKLAGANTLLMSLWKVDDEATRILMTEFYHYFLSGKSKCESLYLAQQHLRSTHPEPEYWAAFILLDGLN